MIDPINPTESSKRVRDKTTRLYAHTKRYTPADLAAVATEAVIHHDARIEKAQIQYTLTPYNRLDTTNKGKLNSQLLDEMRINEDLRNLIRQRFQPELKQYKK